MVDKFPCGCNHWTDHHVDETLTTNLLSLATSLWSRIVSEVKKTKELPHNVSSTEECKSLGYDKVKFLTLKLFARKLAL